jgi:hypothetical protein
MKPASRYFRWFLVASLSLSLVAGGFCSPKMMAGCTAGDSTHHHAAKKCCCGDHCQCGVACPSRGGSDKSQQPTKTADNDLRDLVKIAPAMCGVVGELSCDQRSSKPTSSSCGDSFSPQTLIAQHTCLQV